MRYFERSNVLNEKGTSIVELALAMPFVITLILLALWITDVSAARLLATYAAFMGARAASVQKPDDREGVATFAAMNLAAAPVIAAISDSDVNFRYIAQSPFGPFGNDRVRTGEVLVPLVKFPRMENENDTVGDNPLP